MWPGLMAASCGKTSSPDSGLRSANDTPTSKTETLAHLMIMLMSERTKYPNRSHPGLKALRQKRGLSQDELGFLAGVAQARLSRAERGYLWLGPDECHRVAKALGVEPAVLHRVTEAVDAAEREGSRPQELG